MARHAYVDETTPSRQPAVAEEGAVSETRTSDANVFNLVARILAIVAAAVPTIVGLIAVAKVDWGGPGLDAPAVNVADMVFRPWAAIVTLVLGLLALLAAVSWDRESKLVVGAVLGCIGIAILAANPKIQDVAVNDRTGWMYVLVGVVLILAGLLARQGWTTRRRVGRYADV
jgi:hypothetical protein